LYDFSCWFQVNDVHQVNILDYRWVLGEEFLGVLVLVPVEVALAILTCAWVYFFVVDADVLIGVSQSYILLKFNKTLAELDHFGAFCLRICCLLF
jgi:hypothetical protein